MNKKIMIIAGEASGDLHGGHLVESIKTQYKDVEFFGVGGNSMSSAGVELYYHVDQLSYIGFVEVVKHYPFFRKIFYELLDVVKTRKPDIVVLLDYPGFNLRFAKAIHKLGIKTFFFVAPQVWAWHQSRAKKMAQYIDHLAVIFEFEVPFFSKHGLKTTFVGHPLVEALSKKLNVQQFLEQHKIDPKKPLLALLPGSRRQEVNNLLPTMLDVAEDLWQKYPDLQIAVSKAPTTGGQVVDELVQNDKIKVVSNFHYELLEQANAALVASGTATLETAWFQTPFAIAYKVAPFTFFLGKRLVKIPNIGLANIVAGEKVAEEFIQYDFTADPVIHHVEQLLFDAKVNDLIKSQLEGVKEKLGKIGAIEKTARLVIDML